MRRQPPAPLNRRSPAATSCLVSSEGFRATAPGLCLLLTARACPLPVPLRRIRILNCISTACTSPWERDQSTRGSPRIIAWFGLEGTLKIIWFQPPCQEQGHLPPAQGAQSSIHPGLEPCQGGGSHSFSGQPGPGPHHPPGEEMKEMKKFFTLQVQTQQILALFKSLRRAEAFH